ncbi:MAG: ABC transporter ATP-binding protein, partial [Gammaproteobacteria bacterium]|nr:ABC transporter ATP-binding protein [Gammaproteobacteria bacterium]
GSVQEELAQFTQMISQFFSGARLIKSYGTEHLEKKRAHILIDKILTLVMKMTRQRSLTHPIMETLGGVAIVIVITYGGMQVIAGHQTSGAFFAFITALLLAYEPLKRLANLNAELQERLAGSTRVFEFLDIKPEILNHQNAGSLKDVKGSVSFEDVTFQYNADIAVLKKINFEIPAGKTIALVGPSGSGKSTLMNLIPRFYEPLQGRITIDGKNIQDVTLDSLRQSIALVSQDIMLFDDTIRGNIAYGCQWEREEDIVNAAKAAAAHDFIQNLPQKYDTPVGENGVLLSGGQRQRIALARAFLKNAPILLMDEATSALDTQSEQVIQKALKTLMKGRTTLIIAHRLSTVRDADLIYVLDQGKIVSVGPHEKLLETCDLYAHLCRSQMQSA